MTPFSFTLLPFASRSREKFFRCVRLAPAVQMVELERCEAAPPPIKRREMAVVSGGFDRQVDRA